MILTSVWPSLLFHWLWWWQRKSLQTKCAHKPSFFSCQQNRQYGYYHPWFPKNSNLCGDSSEQEFCWNNRQLFVIWTAAALGVWMELSDHSELVEPVSWKSSEWWAEELPSQGHIAFGAPGFHTDHWQWLQELRPCPAAWIKTWYRQILPTCHSFFFTPAFCSESKLWLLVAEYWVSHMIT